LLSFDEKRWQAREEVFMMREIQLTIGWCSAGLALALSAVLIAQEEFPQHKPAKEVTVMEIPGVVAAGAKWTLVWGGPDNADGVVGYEDGVLFAQEQPNYIGRLDKNGTYSVFAEGTQGTGALGIDSNGDIIGVERSCTDPGQHPNQCKVPSALAELYPKHQILTNNDGKGFGRLHDLVVDAKGGVFFNGPTGVFFRSPKGKLTTITDNTETNGIMLSRNGKTCYFSDHALLMACDVQEDGTCINQRTFAKLEAGGADDGMAIDADGRLYIASGAPGVQVFSSEGKYLGVIPLPRPAASLAFSGADKKTLYAVGSGAVELNGEEYRTRDGVRNNAKSIYKIQMIAQGFMGRVK
jgi:gluconolactonase